MIMIEYGFDNMIHGFVDGTGVGIDVFVEASQALVQPLEAFFNNVFVMAVSGLFSCMLYSVFR